MSEYDKPPPYAPPGAVPAFHDSKVPPQHEAPPVYTNYGTTPQGAASITVNAVPTQIIVVGGCPSCRIGVLEDDYSCLGILCAICFFPIGILCCLAMKRRQCPNCGAIFG